MLRRTPAPDVRALSAADVERLTRRLARAVLASGPRPDRLVIVARGGLVVGGLLAGLLDVGRVESVQLSAYAGRRRLRAPRLLGRAPAPAGPSGRPERTLVVDELVESGGTLRRLAALLPRARRAVLLVKGPLAPGSPRAPGRVLPAALRDLPGGGPVLAAATVPAARWVLFPWSPPAERRG